MPAQRSLLQDAASIVLDDATGRIDYLPSLLEPEQARDAMQDLLIDVPWRGEERSIYGRRVAVPRLQASYRLAASNHPPAIAAIETAVRARVPVCFDAVGLNLYRDAQDSVAPHNDHLYEIAPGEPIALVSLGATRTMVISSKRAPRRSLRLDLEAGSLLLMSWATQQHYDHGIPKQRTPAGARISLAFRVRPRA
jgi:alkylated DNA repair dioxygenase AlkB